MGKKEREQKVLFSLIDLYISDHQPVGSKTLMEKCFPDLSSATIRNYFASLEKAGYLSQQHASGGRIPTELAYQSYAEEFLKSGTLDEEKDLMLRNLSSYEEKKVGAYLQRAVELLSSLTGFPTFISAPRFDHDFVVDIKLVVIDQSRCLCVVITDLGLIHSEVFYSEQKLHHHALKRIEEVLLSRVKGCESSMRLDAEEELLAHKVYNEVMVRYIIGYANFSLEEVYSTGLSRLLAYPEFNNAQSFASGLALFENPNSLRALLKESCSDNNLKTFIGSELSQFTPLSKQCAVVSIPYCIGGSIVGAVGVLGPVRMPYRKLFGITRAFVEYIETALSKSMLKHKLTYRTPQDASLYLENESEQVLLEDQSQLN